MSALVFLAPGFEEIEGITVIDILRRAEIETVVAGLVTNPIGAARHSRHLADVHLADVDPAREFEVVVLPGGAEGAKRLAESPLVRDWLARQRERNQWRPLRKGVFARVESNGMKFWAIFVVTSPLRGALGR